MGMHVRRAQVEDRERLLAVWERSVRATHHFLGEGGVAALRPLVAEELASDAIDWWVLVSTGETPIGFLGFANATIEALFVDPDHHGRGGGKLLVAHAQSLAAGALAVDVNEQNEAAVRFYEAQGFTVVGRSPTDAGGRPFPILHMRRAAMQPLPHRAAPRPQTSKGMPHAQIGVAPEPGLDRELRRRAFALPGVLDRPSIISVPGARALWLADDVELLRPESVLRGREFAHIHPDGSLHAALSPERAREAIAAGWAEPHPIAEQLGMPGLVMLYTPRTMEELAVVVGLVVDSYNFVTGRSIDPAGK